MLLLAGSLTWSVLALRSAWSANQIGDSPWPEWPAVPGAGSLDVTQSIVFRWSPDRFALLETTTGRVRILIPDHTALRVEAGPTLETPQPSSQALGELFSDLVERSVSGDIYWLSRSMRRLKVFDRTGRLVSASRTPCQPWSLLVDNQNDGVTILGHQCASNEAGYYALGRDGNLRAFRPSWLEPARKGDDLGASLAVPLAKEGTAEFLVYLPFVRVERAASVQILRADSCAAVAANIREKTSGDDHQFGLPRPLGTGFIRPRPASTLFFLAATSTPNGRAFAVANGGALFTLESNGELSCSLVPLPDTGPRYVLIGVQATSTHLAITHMSGGRRFLRVWDRGSDIERCTNRADRGAKLKR